MHLKMNKEQKRFSVFLEHYLNLRTSYFAHPSEHLKELYEDSKNTMDKYLYEKDSAIWADMFNKRMGKYLEKDNLSKSPAKKNKMLPLNTIIEGNCLEVLKSFSAASIDMVLTSPPYDNLRDYKGYTFDFEGIAKELYRVTKDGGVVVWVVGDATIKGSETGTSFKQALYFKEIEVFTM